MNWERLLTLDRRVIFLIMTLVIALPIIFPFGLPTHVTDRTQRLFDTIDETREDQAVLLSTDYTPQTEPELHPMYVSILRHCFARHIRVLMVTLYIEAAGLMDVGLHDVMDEFNARATTHEDSIIMGEDVVFLGWKPPPIIPILAMGQDIGGFYKQDFYGNDLANMPVMEGIKNYRDISIVVAFSSGSSPLWFVQFAQTRFGVKVGAGVTAVSVADFYPYLESGQFSGLLGGMKGAAEYEELVEREVGVPGRRRATEGMSSQSAAHLAIMVFVIIGNIGYFATRRKR